MILAVNSRLLRVASGYKSIVVPFFVFLVLFILIFLYQGSRGIAPDKHTFIVSRLSSSDISCFLVMAAFRAIRDEMLVEICFYR